MSLSQSELATLNFYKWEYLHRGYYHFDTPVDIEVPYTRFTHREYISSGVDDGQVPSIWERVAGLVKPKEQEKKQEEAPILEPTLLSPDDVPNLVGFSISFPKAKDINPIRNQEFLNMLSFSCHPISFEILGTFETITIQMVCSTLDKERLQSHLKAYLPNCILKEIEVDSFEFYADGDIAIADFGVNDEFMRPIQTVASFIVDPLTSIIATLDNLQIDDTALFQILFKGLTSPLAKDIVYAVSDGAGGSFLADAPEMLSCATDKIASPLFSVVMRIAAQGNSNSRSQYLAQELARSISTISHSEYNKLIPLSNEGYSYDFHIHNVHKRLSNRLGFVLNSKELNTFIHYPNKSVVSAKLGLQGGKTKLLPKETIQQKYILGINSHNGIENEVSLHDEARLKHTHIIGATGVGKSTLIANMIIEDMSVGNGCALFDPHGDIVEDILLRIPEHRKQDVIIIAPSDIEFPIGFNLLAANTEIEKIVLSSDLVSAFKRHATAWGDNMTAVLSNAINTFLESSRSGTLIELKRFLLEENFRNEFLASVSDNAIHYYWEHEYPIVRKRIAPLLTRIDTFLRPKIIRYMLAQNNGVDFRACIEQKKIVLIKLSQGLIGEENSYLLGSLFLSKFNQAAQGRQSIAKSQRHPYYIYLDEFQNFITPSITSMLSGARKYGLGLILAHQELGQIEDSKVLNSIISNPYTRICFRLGDNDAKRLETGFSYFDHSDLLSLGVGEAIMRVGSSNNDFNISTFPLPKTSQDALAIQQSIIDTTRIIHAQPKRDVEVLLENLLPKKQRRHKEILNSIEKTPIEKIEVSTEEVISKEIPNEVKEKLILQEEVSISNRDHSYLQNVIKKLGQERGFISTIEKETNEGGRIDVALEKEAVKIAFEISITNTPEYEIKNIKKCLSNGYSPIVMVSKNKNHLNKIQALAKKELAKKDLDIVLFIQPDEITTLLDGIQIKKKKSEEIVKGFRIITEFDESKISNPKNIREHIAKLLFKKK